jgi:hypothetical protein
MPRAKPPTRRKPRPPRGTRPAPPADPLAAILARLAESDDELISRWARRLAAGEQEEAPSSKK